MFTEQQKAALAAPLNGQHVKRRQQAGRSLAYIEGWKVIDEANRTADLAVELIMSGLGKRIL